MTHVHIYTPRPCQAHLQKQWCPTCEKARWMTQLLYAWYGWTMTCLKCGETWTDGEMHPRPFMPRWRQKSVEDAKAVWRRHSKNLAPMPWEGEHEGEPLVSKPPVAGADPEEETDDE